MKSYITKLGWNNTAFGKYTYGLAVRWHELGIILTKQSDKYLIYIYIHIDLLKYCYSIFIHKILIYIILVVFKYILSWCQSFWY